MIGMQAQGNQLSNRGNSGGSSNNRDATVNKKLVGSNIGIMNE